MLVLYTLFTTVKPLFFVRFYFENFLKIRKKLPNSTITVEKTHQPGTLDPAEYFKAKKGVLQHYHEYLKR